MDCPVWQAGMDHNVNFPATVPKLKPVGSLLDVCLRNGRLWNLVSHVSNWTKNHTDVQEFNV